MISPSVSSYTFFCNVLLTNLLPFITAERKGGEQSARVQKSLLEIRMLARKAFKLFICMIFLPIREHVIPSLTLPVKLVF